MKTTLHRLQLASVVLIAVLGCHVSTVANPNDNIKKIKIEEVVVNSTRMNKELKNIPQKVEIITSEELQSLPADNLAEVLKRTVNIDMVQYPGVSATVGMRGFSPSAHSRSYTLLLINGKPSGTTNIASINLENVERVEVIKGPYSTLYGSDAMGGVINIITKKSSGEPTGSVSLSSGSFGKFGLKSSVGGDLSENVSFRLGYSRDEQRKNYRIGKKNFLDTSEKDKQILDKSSFGDAMDNSAYEINHVNGNIDFTLSDNWSFNTEVMYTFGHDIQTPGNYWGTYGQSKKDIDRLNLYTNLEWKTSDNSLRFSPYYTSEKDPNYSDNTEDGFINFTSDIKEYGFQLQDNVSLGNLSFVAGVDLGVYDYESERFESKGTPTAPYKPNNSNTNIGAFTQLAYTLGNLDVNAGVRYDHYKYQIEKNDSLNAPKANENYSAVNPSFGAQYRLLQNFKVHGSYGKAYSVPDAYKVAGKYDVSVYFAEWDYLWVKKFVGNDELEPEKSTTYDLGFKYFAPTAGLMFDFTYFNTDHTNKIIEESLESGEYTYVNADKSKMDGLEIVTSFDLGALNDYKYKLELYANWTFLLNNDVTQSTLNAAGADSTYTQEMQYVCKTNGNFGIYFDNKKGFSTRLNGRYHGARLEEDGFTLIRPEITSEDYYSKGGYSANDKMLKHPSFITFDYSVSYTLANKMKLGVTVSNLLDENYTEKDGYNMPGRSVTGTISYSF